MERKKAHQIFRLLAENIPSPRTELRYENHFELLISVILSAQATDVSVNRATAKLFPMANTPSAVLELGVRDLKTSIRTIGLYNTKAKNIIKTCQILRDQFDSKVPSTRRELESLPGVGRKTANVILNTAFRQPTIGVDTHIFRLSNRTGLAPGKNVLEVEKKLVAVTPEDYLLDAHHLLILHGRYICKAKNPHCSDCVIRNLCQYTSKTKE